ncbi:DUF4811 domain-containing protein [Periweissella cryptocerci]|uniref:DUF4811 domain-containing protein n=1 Tax=Periweissella cryptocerci TaxID=2506420 RepID=A0A4P6YUD4_9LACO|nr:DUF4811 domain-containing protein [Periweissella cryptocerci]QBO36399.1 DUF4811 domain-containing protein [Periweissella cryptocerci]
MILTLVIISAILFFIFFVLIYNRFVSYVLSFIAFILLVGSLFMLVENDHSHLGMTKVTTEKQTVIYSAGDSKSPISMLLYQPIGTNGHDNVYIYKAAKKDKKPSHTQTDGKTTNKVKLVDSDTATLEVKTTRYEYKRSLDKFLFGIGGNDKEVVKRVNTFNIPKEAWAKLSVKAAKKLAKEMQNPSKAQQAEQKAAAKAYIEGKMKAAMMADPTMATSPSRQAALVKQATQEFQTMAIKQAIDAAQKADK